jgi:hypothetical protein
MKLLRFSCSIVLLGFLLGIHEGKIALWNDNDPEPMQVFPYRAEMLPEVDQKALKKGIRVKSIRQLHSLIEDYLS